MSAINAFLLKHDLRLAQRRRLVRLPRWSTGHSLVRSEESVTARRIRRHREASVLAPVVVVEIVAVAVVHVVDMVAVRHGLVTAAGAVRVRVGRVRDVRRDAALVPVRAVPVVHVTVVEIVDVVTMMNGDVAAPDTVDMRVLRVRAA